jgi:hypothetical protein
VLPLLPPADVAATPVAFVVGIGVVFLLVPIVVVETIVLRLLRWGGLLLAFLVALVMNVASALVGAVVLGVAAGAPSSDAEKVLLISLPPALVLSILIEGSVMWGFQRRSAGRTFGVAAIANAVTYVMLAGLVVLADTQ